MAFVLPTNVTVGSVLTASKFNQDVVANTIALPRGMVNRVELTAAPSPNSFTSVADVAGLTVNVAQTSGRIYIYTVRFDWNSSVAGDIFDVILANSSNTQLYRQRILAGTTATQIVGANATWYEVAGSTATVDRKIRFGRSSIGTGTGAISVASNNPAQFFVMDAGEAP
jgi:hypothetical protein